MDEIIEAINSLRVLLMKKITKRPATYHAVDVLSKIAGWELAALLGDDSVDMYAKARQIYMEAIEGGG